MQFELKKYYYFKKFNIHIDYVLYTNTIKILI